MGNNYNGPDADSDGVVEAGALDHATMLGVDMRRVITHAGGDFILHHNDFTLADVSGFRLAPARFKGVVILEDVKSLAAYVNLYHALETEGPVAYHSESSKQINVVIDHHGRNDANWGEHRASYTAKYSPAYAAWKALAGDPRTTQENFAEFLEEHILDIVMPNGAAMLEIVETMHASMSGKFHRAIRRENGSVALAYDETVSAVAGAHGQLEVPRKLEISVAAFDGGPRYKIPLSLKYRVSGGSVMWGFTAPGLQEFERQAWDDLVKIFAESLAPDVRPLVGLLRGSPKKI